MGGGQMESFGLSSNQVAGRGRQCLQFSLHLKDHLLFLKEPQTWVYILTLLLIYRLGIWRRSLPSLGLSSRGHLGLSHRAPRESVFFSLPIATFKPF